MGKIFIGNKNIPKNPIKKLIRCCSCKKEYDFKGNIFSSNKGKILICPHCGLKHKIDFRLFKDKIGNLIKINGFNLIAIDIGSAAIVRADGNAPGKTYVNRINPANETGKITSVEIYAFTGNGTLTNVKVATFQHLGSNYFTTRDWEAIGDVVEGAKRTFTVDLNVVAGDYIGIYFEGGWIFAATSGDGFWYVTADKIPCTNDYFSLDSTGTLSLYGTGVTSGEVKNASGKSDLTSSITISLSRGKIEGAVGKADISSSIISVLSRGRVENVNGKSNISTSIIAVLSRGKIENVSGKVDIMSIITSVLSRGKVENVIGKANIISLINVLLSRGKIELVSGKSDINTSINISLSRGRIESVSGKSDITSIVNIILSRGKIENATGKVNITSTITVISSRGKIEDVSGIASITTLINALFSVRRIKDASGKSQFDTNIDAILHRIISVNGKATLNTLYDVTIGIGELLDVKGKTDINSLVNVNLKRILNVNGKSIFDTLIEIEVKREIVFTQATLGISITDSLMKIEETGSEFDIINVTANPK